mgnify:CR=1 FL=1
MAKILVVDDEIKIREIIKEYAEFEGYEVAQAEDGMQAVEMVKNQDFDIIIMDVMMPKLDGIRATLKIREKNALPIIILSAKSEDADKILGLNVGADDYVTKPFNPLELMARVKSQLRRYRDLNPANEKKEEEDSTIRLNHVTIIKETHQVFVDGESVKLTPIEFDILYLLASHPGRVFSTDEIFEKVWNEKVYEANNTVMVHIRRLRGKMKDDTRTDKIITTVWGVGYKIEQ